MPSWNCCVGRWGSYKQVSCVESKQAVAVDWREDRFVGFFWQWCDKGEAKLFCYLCFCSIPIAYLGYNDLCNYNSIAGKQTCISCFDIKIFWRWRHHQETVHFIRVPTTLGRIVSVEEDYIFSDTARSNGDITASLTASPSFYSAL